MNRIKRFFSELNPFIRGLLVVASIAAVVVVFQLYTTLAVVSGLLRIAFFLAVAFFVYMLWRDRRAQIDLWQQRSRVVFYAAAVLIVLDLGVYFSPYTLTDFAGFDALAFIGVLAICAYSMWRVWRSERDYGG